MISVGAVSIFWVFDILAWITRYQRKCTFVYFSR